MRIRLREISITPITPTKKGIIAFVNYIINDSFKVCDTAIATDLKNGGYRLIYPIKQIPSTTKTIQVFYPITTEASNQITKQVLKAYEQITKQSLRGYK
ncbi:MAG: SpoVG family protein [Candidatus Margulisbacteria bacterium]|nr:SpoVG family protein [Candidatus Margulisiibacteriota bacterium]